MSELSETDLKFPCQYPVKVFGVDENDFIGFVIELISHHVPDLPDDAFTTHRSSGGKYVSVSVTFMAESRIQVDALNEELTTAERIVFAL